MVEAGRRRDGVEMDGNGNPIAALVNESEEG